MNEDSQKSIHISNGLDEKSVSNGLDDKSISIVLDEKSGVESNNLKDELQDVSIQDVSHPKIKRK